MIEVEMTKDIQEYEPTIIGPFTKRQVISIALGLLLAVPLIVFLPFDIMTNIIIGCIAMAPFIVAGWVKLFGMNAEVFLRQIIESTFLSPATRKYKPKNSFEYLYPNRPSTGKVIKSKEYKGLK